MSHYCLPSIYFWPRRPACRRQIRVSRVGAARLWAGLPGTLVIFQRRRKAAANHRIVPSSRLLLPGGCPLKACRCDTAENLNSRCSHRPAPLNQNKCLLPKEEDFRKVAIERPAARVTRTPHSVTESSHQNNSTFPTAPRPYDSPRTHGAAPRTPPQPYGRAKAKVI